MMKVYLLTIVVLLGMSSNVCGQTASKLFKKYKALPEAQWVNRTDSFRIEAKQAKEKGETQVTDEQLDTVLKGIKRLEQITLPLTDELKEQMDKDCEKLKDYELLLSTSRNIDENRKAEPGLPPIFSPMFNPDFTMKMYAKTKGEQVKDVLVRTDIMNIICLVHMETDLPKDMLSQALKMEDYLPLDEEGEVVSMAEIVKAYKRGEVLIVINGKQHPELHSEKEADKYLKENKISWNKVSWIVGKAVKEQYPDTKFKVVIEYCNQEESKE